MKAEMKAQVDSIVQALGDTVIDLGNKAEQWGTNFRAQLMNAVEAIVSDIMTKGLINMDGEKGGQYVPFGNCAFRIEPGMNTYSSKTCVWCCNCANNMNAVRLYLAWRLDCRP
jgi:hypothetical protein